MKYEGKDRRRADASPVRARRRTVPAEILRQVKGIELRTRSLVNTLFTGGYRSVFRGQGIEFAEVREYQQGDDFRAIDWNVSARMGHPFVKTFMEERELTLLLVVDQSGSQHFGRPHTKAALAVEVAAVLALAAARHNDRVGRCCSPIVWNRSSRRRKAGPTRCGSFATSWRSSRAAGAPIWARRCAIPRGCCGTARSWPCCRTFAPTPGTTPLAQLTARHEVVAITVDDPREAAYPNAGWVDLEDAETGHRVLLNTSHRGTRDRVRIAAERLLQERSRRLLQAGVDRVALRTDVPYGVTLRRAFAERAKRVKR